MSDGDGTWSDETDWELSDEVAEVLEEAAAPPPVVAVVGRPNVGKSTLVNRILGRREAVVQDIPGVTRDRVSYDANWLGRRFMVQDTGGWEPDAKGLQQLVADQALVAMRTADAIVVVVDATVGATATDEAVARQVQDAAEVAGVALSLNLTGAVFVNQTAAFSDFHGTGANPAANAALSDSAYVSNRFRVVQTRRHI